MHYKRKVEQDKTDVRSKSYFIYGCNLCGYEHWFNWTSNFSERLRTCPQCGVTDDVDERTMLLQRKQHLEQKTQPFLDEIKVVDARLVALAKKLDAEEKNGVF